MVSYSIRLTTSVYSGDFFWFSPTIHSILLQYPDLQCSQQSINELSNPKLVIAEQEDDDQCGTDVNSNDFL